MAGKNMARLKRSEGKDNIGDSGSIMKAAFAAALQGDKECPLISKGMKKRLSKLTEN